MKNIQVAGAIIKKDDLILIAQRKSGEFQGLWEFPGGKLENNETSEEALIREIKEELEIDIEINEFLITAKHDYPSFHLNMDCFLCSIKNDITTLNDHSAIAWIPLDIEINSIHWVPADVQVMQAIQDKFKRS